MGVTGGTPIGFDVGAKEAGSTLRGLDLVSCCIVKVQKLRSDGSGGAGEGRNLLYLAVSGSAATRKAFALPAGSQRNEGRGSAEADFASKSGQSPASPCLACLLYIEV